MRFFGHLFLLSFAIFFAGACSVVSYEENKVMSVDAKGKVQSSTQRRQIADISRDGRLPSEDLEVKQVCADIIAVLQNPSLGCNTKEKYDAAKELLSEVDLTFTRETKTINEIFYHGDAIFDNINAKNRNITFNYQYGENFVRITFHTYMNFVFRVDITEK